jgi:hypothetical protein
MKTSSLLQRILAGIFLLASLQACSTNRSLPPSTPVTPAPTKSPGVEARNNSWTPKISKGRWQYFIRDSSTILINNDTTARVEPIESTTIYTMSIADSDNSLLVTGHVDSLLVNSRLPRKAHTDTGAVREFSGLISRQGRLVRVTDIAPTACTGGSVSPLSRLTELLTFLPAHPVTIGDKWSDTTSTTICHGKIPLTQTAVREYELLDLSSCQRAGAKIRRIVSDVFAGSSSETSNHLSASGSGTASSILCLDQATGVLLSSDGQSRLELTVTTTRGVFPFTQNTSTHIETR